LVGFADFYQGIQNICPLFERNARIYALARTKPSRDLPVAMADTVISAQEQAGSHALQALLRLSFATFARRNLAKITRARIP